MGVDTFFVISGFLTSYLFLKQIQKQNFKLNVKTVFLYYFHRIWRLTLLLGVLVLFYTTIFGRILRGPGNVKQKVFDVDEIKACKRNWWATLTYTSNLVHKPVSSLIFY